MAGGRPRKYKTAKALQRAVEAYFRSISRTCTAQERFDTGKKDSDGHAVFEYRDIVNDDGAPIRYLDYPVPPTVGGLCEHLNICRATWAEYCDQEKHPEFSDTTTRAQGRMRAYNERELLTRKDVKGVIFNLQNNFDYREKREVEVGPQAAAALNRPRAMTLDEKEKMLSELRDEVFGTSEQPEGEGP